MDAYHAAQRRPSLHGELPSVSSSEPSSETELAEAVDTAVTRIVLAEGATTRTEDSPRQQARVHPSTGRADLIRRAMALHKEKQSVLAGLDEETRQKLANAAMQAFFNEKSKT
ncbi:MAG: hypothetical protein JXQ84_09140 [Rhodospirillaceae bacterium]|nr:hypothetical protein [Rhodospirillaceae bacterium]